MAERKSIFDEDWRESLRAHYIDVVRRNDQATEATLVGVLHDVGFRDDELRELKLRATMRAEDLHDDFVPQLDLDDEAGHGVIEEPTVHPVAKVETPEPQAVAEPAPEPTDERYIAEEIMDEQAEQAEDPESEDSDEEPPPEDPDTPQQMSLF